MPILNHNEEAFRILEDILDDPALDTWTMEETDMIRVLDLTHRPYPYMYHTFLYDPYESVITLVTETEDLETCWQKPPFKVSGNVAIYKANLSTQCLN